MVLKQTDLTVLGLSLNGFESVILCCEACRGDSLQGNDGLSHCFCPFKSSMAFSTTFMCDPPRTSSLFRVNREIRDEEFKIFYSRNDFYITATIDSAIRDLQAVEAEYFRRVETIHWEPE